MRDSAIRKRFGVNYKVGWLVWNWECFYHLEWLDVKRRRIQIYRANAESNVRRGRPWSTSNMVLQKISSKARAYLTSVIRVYKMYSWPYWFSASNLSQIVTLFSWRASYAWCPLKNSFFPRVIESFIDMASPLPLHAYTTRNVGDLDCLSNNRITNFILQISW